MPENPNVYSWPPLRQDSLYFSSGDETVVLRPTDLLVAIDETGIEDMSDRNYPVFGIGGCGVLAGHFLDLIAHPWGALKDQYFDGGSAPLHAAKLPRTSVELLTPVGVFFRKHPFFRFAALLTSETTIVTPQSRYLAVSKVILDQIAAFGRTVPFEQVFFLFEDSQRANNLVKYAFAGLRMTRHMGGHDVEIKVHKFRSDKSLCYPALEVADFVMHAAGTATLANRRTGRRMLERPDFAAVFGSYQPPLSSYFCIDQIRFEDLHSVSG